MSAYARLRRHYRAADPATLDRGRRWYREACRRMQALADETGYTLDQAVAVMAVTSPGAQLRTNLDWTERALRSHGEERVGRFPNRMMPAIRAILDSPAYAHEYVTGPKVGPFFRAILGDEDALVLDRWALYAAGLADREAAPAPRLRREIEAAYRRAAEACGESVRDFQAIVWIHVRETTPRAGGGTVRYADIV